MVYDSEVVVGTSTAASYATVCTCCPDGTPVSHRSPYNTSQGPQWCHYLTTSEGV